MNELNTLRCGSTTITFKVYSGAFLSAKGDGKASVNDEANYMYQFQTRGVVYFGCQLADSHHFMFVDSFKLDFSGNSK
ncbi:hypothetical protein [Paenibacillus illinoisensis]|uniref:hypothetical protein n=1 Tax=Paenibacillus illinoisensis TaxID=59845 RepID=UPI001C8DEA6E|nr:hypothetical protein [Paenibacillus illinoisensis]